MNTSDLITIAAVAIPAMGCIVGWLWKHSTRLTGAEIRIEGLTTNAEADRRRSDGVYQDIRATLTRIEDKLDRKADR
jgi:hypothetical protein